MFMTWPRSNCRYWLRSESLALQAVPLLSQPSWGVLQVNKNDQPLHNLTPISPVVPPRGGCHIGSGKQGLSAQIVRTVQQISLQGLGLLIITPVPVLTLDGIAAQEDESQANCTVTHLSFYRSLGRSNHIVFCLISNRLMLVQVGQCRL